MEINMNDITNAERINLMKEKLIEALKPYQLDIVDESHLHAGHPEAQASGGGHFNLEIVSDVFSEKSQIERHRMIYAALGESMGTDIHALSINALTPNEANLTSNLDNPDN